MQVKIGMSFQMGDTLTEVYRRTPYRAVHVITFAKRNSAKKEPSWPVMPVIRAFILNYIEICYLFSLQRFHTPCKDNAYTGIED